MYVRMDAYLSRLFDMHNHEYLHTSQHIHCHHNQLHHQPVARSNDGSHRPFMDVATHHKVRHSNWQMNWMDGWSVDRTDEHKDGAKRDRCFSFRHCHIRDLVTELANCECTTHYKLLINNDDNKHILHLSCAFE